MIKFILNMERLGTESFGIDSSVALGLYCMVKHIII